MIIYLSQGTQTTQNTQMNADIYFFLGADRRSPLFLRASAPVCVVCVLLIQCAKFPFIVRFKSGCLGGQSYGICYKYARKVTICVYIVGENANFAHCYV